MNHEHQLGRVQYEDNLKEFEQYLIFCLDLYFEDRDLESLTRSLGNKGRNSKLTLDLTIESTYEYFDILYENVQYSILATKIAKYYTEIHEN